MPRPKSEPPKPPMAGSTDEQFQEWGKVYTQWKDENSHLPNLQPAETIIERFEFANESSSTNVGNIGGNPTSPITGNWNRYAGETTQF